jgi:hypothetical protein
MADSCAWRAVARTGFRVPVFSTRRRESHGLSETQLPIEPYRCEGLTTYLIASSVPRFSRGRRYPRFQSSNPTDCANISEVAAETELHRDFVQFGLGEEELMLRVGIGIETDDDLGPSDRVTYAVVKGVA